MQNLKENLVNLLRENEKYYVDGNLLKNKLTEDALKHDNNFLKILLKDKKIKTHFFDTIDGIMIFDKDKFINFINDKEFLPDSYTSYRAKIGLMDSQGNYLSNKKDVVLAWPYKDCVLEGGQDTEDQKRSEIFYNEILAPDEIDRLVDPKALTNFKKYTAEGIEENPDISMDDNYIIKGNNLLALHSLKQKYRGKVKLIYIDPPYNTGSDSFRYNDRFNHSTWLTFMKNRLEIAKELLTMDGIICVQCDDKEQAYLKVLMDEVFENRFLNNVAVKMSEATGVKMNHAKGRFPKLKEFILMYKMPDFNGFITVDKYEQKKWDTENNIFIENLTEKERSELIELETKETNDQTDVNNANEILKKAKKISLATKLKELDFENEDEKNEWLFKNSYRIIKTAGSSSLTTLVKSLDKIPKQDIAVAVSKKGVLFFYITDFNRETMQPRLRVIFADSNIFKNPCDFWQDIKTTGSIADEGGVKLKNGKKPEKILHRLIKMITKESDIVLDYHLGSGTTAAVAHKMNRKYIGIEQLDYGKNSAVERLKNVIGSKKDSLVNEYKEYDKSGISKDVNWSGGGSFIYCELMEWNQAYIDKIQSAKDGKELIKLYKSMKGEAFFRYDFDEKEMDMIEFKKLKLDAQKKILIELLDKNHLYVNRTEIEDSQHKVSKEDIEMNYKFYGQEGYNG